MKVRLGDGSGGFTDISDKATITGALSGFGINPNSIESVDLNNDGLLDLAVTYENRDDNEGIAIFIANPPAIVGSTNENGDTVGIFQPVVEIDPGTSFPSDTRAVATGDFDNDNNADLVVLNSSPRSFSILLGDGSGGFNSTEVFGINGSPVDVVVDDFDGDGNQDLAIKTENNDDIEIYLGNGNGDFSLDSAIDQSGAFAGNLVSGDFNEDGRPDLATVDQFVSGGDSLSIYLNTTTSNSNPTGGDDSLTGTNGNDTINGLGGDDTIDGLAGNDDLIGANGNDSLIGNDGNDILRGGNGEDILSGDIGTDRIFGGNDNDLIRGGADRDTLIGNSGNDEIYGDNNQDILKGGNGNDTLYGGEGNDVAFGNEGSDVFVLEPNSGRMILRDYVDSVDQIGLSEGLSFNDLRIVNNSSGNRVIIRDRFNNNALLGVVFDNNDVLDATDLTESDFISV